MNSSGSEKEEERSFLHDIANIVTLATGQVRLLQRKTQKAIDAGEKLDPHEVTEYLSRIEKAGQETSSLVRLRRNNLLLGEKL